MDGKEWIWLGVGLILGVVGSRLGGRLPARATNSDLPALQQLQAQLQQLQLAYQMVTEMNQFKGGFLARISHEIRSPLNGLIGMHQLILTDLCDSPEEERQFLEQANLSALKLSKLLDQILDVAKVQYGSLKLQLQPVELAGLLREVYDLTQLQARDRNLRFAQPECEPGLYTLIDPRWLRQVLISLIDMAIKQMPEGNISLTATRSPEAGQLALCLTDQRPASAWSEALSLLETEPDDPATFPSPGLNLLNSQLLLEKMGGRLELIAPETSEADSPGRLLITIPLLDAPD